MRARLVPMLLVAALAVPAALPAGAAASVATDDVVVVAVIDGNFSPYHWNFMASKMPQHQDGDPSNDLPLDQAPDTWIPGMDASGFTSYNRIDLTLDETNPNRTTASLQTADTAKWNSVQTSTSTATHYYWFPGTKIVGGVDFAGNDLRSTNSSHGGGTSSVSVGNITGTCPECVVVLVTYNGSSSGYEWALNWAMSQPWIDVVTNSYGFSKVERDRIYNGGNAAQQKAASERGQRIFFSSGNGISNTFTVPNTTLFSSQEGPDWTVTVGAIAPSGGDYTGAGKPADVAAVGSSYPSIGGTTVTGTGTFGGTSNATPVMAGLYARALWWARQRLDGPSKVQAGGVIAEGAPVTCGASRTDCELADGKLTAEELTTRLLHGAIRTPEGLNPGGVANTPTVSDEVTMMAEGHGSYWARMNSTAQWQAEQARITGPMDGTAALTPRPDGERDWMLVDSYCRQSIWGSWSGGYYKGAATPLPLQSPLYPIRSALQSTCGNFVPPPF